MPIFKRDIPNHFSLPRRIARLGELSYNLWWTWNIDAQKLFSLINKSLWEQLNHNPVCFLKTVDRYFLNAMTDNRYYLDLYDRVMAKFDQYLKSENSWFTTVYPGLNDRLAAYFSFEFGLHESLPVYAGGLGVLSGDHLKEASDLGLPLVGVGFIYTEGYFTQHITEDGWQETRTTHLDLANMPVFPILDESNQPARILVELPDRQVAARIWQVQVGRIPLYLLDTNVEENSANDRQLTARLYSHDPEVRISQEILLGIGGVRALRLLGYNPAIWHMNEGHSAFLSLERARELVAQGLTFQQAADHIRASNIFTTHTPVPAGNDQFPVWLAEKYFSHLWPQLNLSRDEFIELAQHAQSWGEVFSMPVLALHLSEHRNAVSELHGQVSRKMWHFLWSDRDVDQVPITHVTNGVHTSSWMARRLGLLFDRYLGADWLDRLDDPSLWTEIVNIPDGEIWAVRQHLKRKLLNLANYHARRQWLAGDIHPVQVVAGGVLLEPYSLTIGFARRFATYKRGNLILSDLDRLLRIINNPQMPVQIIFAGKAHPADEPGKLIIQQVYRLVKDHISGGRLVFLEDYDMNLARYLVQGVDVWLNTPRRPNEASGTSGMKAAINGVLNFSVLDGWWHEAYNGRNGWAIGNGKDFEDTEQQDAADAASLYDILEKEIVPLYYYGRNSSGFPSEWIARMKESIRTLVPQFSTRRMVKEYVNQLYLPAFQETEPVAPVSSDKRG